MNIFIDGLLHRVTKLVTHCTFGVIAAFSAKFAGAGFTFLFSMLLARLLGPADTGVYFLALTIVSIAATITRLGLNNAILRFASVAHAQGDRCTLAALYRQGIGLVVVAGSIVTIIVWLIVPFLSLGRDNSYELQAVVSMMLFAIVPTALVLILGEFFKATSAPGIAIFTQAVVLPMLMVVEVVTLLEFGNITVHDVAFLYVVAAFASVLLTGTAWSRRMPGLWKEKGNFDVLLLLRTSLPLLWVANMNLIMGWTDVIVLGIWTNSDVVGVYGIAVRIAALTAFVLVAVNSVTAPRFASLYAEGNLKALERLAQRSAGWMLLAESPVIIVLLLFPEWILHFFGSGFESGVLLVRVLALGQLVSVALGSVGPLLMMTGNEQILKNSIMLSAFVNLTGNLILIPMLGGLGAAISTASSLALINVISFVFVYKKLKVNTLGYLFKLKFRVP